MANEEKQPETQLAKAEKPNLVMTRHGFMPTNLDDAWRFADALAKSQLIPTRFQGHPADCLVAIDAAARMGCSPLAVLQNCYVVHGTPGYMTPFVIGLINTSGLFRDPLEFDVEGDNPFDQSYRVRATAVRASTGKTINGPWIDWKVVKAEGWDKPKGDQKSKWTTMPGQMFLYRAAMWFKRAYCPEVTDGVLSVDEIEDVGPKHIESREVRGVQGVVEKLKSQSNGESKGAVESPKTQDAPSADTDQQVEDILDQPEAEGIPAEDADSAEALMPAVNKPPAMVICPNCQKKGRPFMIAADKILNGKCPQCFQVINVKS